MLGLVIICTQVAYTFRKVYAMILTRHMIGHEVYYHLHASLMGSLHESLELHHTLRNVLGYVRIHVIIIRNGIWRTSLALNHASVLARNTVLRVICSSSMTNDTCIPHVRKAHVVYFPQSDYIKVVHLPHPILGKRTILLKGSVAIAEKAREDLVYNNLFVHRAIRQFREQPLPCRCDESCLAKPCLGHTP